MKKTVLLICTLFVLVSCSTNDDSDTPNLLEGGTITATVNGQNLFANADNTINISGQFVEINGVFILQVGAGLLDGRSVAVGISGIDFDAVVDGFDADADDENEDFSAKLFYFEADNDPNDEDADLDIGGESELDAYVKITSIDKVNKVISGEFNGIVLDDDDFDITYVVTDGVFTNISYQEL
ncbi:MAG: hypothetical protein AAFX55_06460 [Bacteroidota bacterium]